MVAMAWLGVGGAVSGAGAQISPGPLARAHRSLEGVGKCFECHQLGRKDVGAQCLECHGEIAMLRKGGHGLHAREGAGECASCHPDHGGVDFDLVGWKDGPAGFDHDRAGWTLDGAHASIECEQCHRQDFHVPAIVVARPEGASPPHWTGLAADCAGCHRDPHENRFGTSCRDCHGTTDFHAVQNASFDHDRTDFPLRGKHRGVNCAGCHGASLTEPVESGTCAACHDDPHRGKATVAGVAVDCASCHTVGGFVPSTFGAARHAQSTFPLAGKHADVACAGCHRPAGSPFAFRPASGRCADCHDDAHRGELGAAGIACENCHRVTGFSPSTFSVAQHAATSFPLEGAHAGAACRSCHGPAPVRFAFASTGCIDCHADPHREQLGSDDAACRSCHSVDAFHPVQMEGAAHARSGFPLDGAHAAIPCFECHRAMVEPRPASTLTASAGTWPDLAFHEDSRCASCHDDPHRGQFREGDALQACSTCHGTEAFAPASRFDHEAATDFPLRGAHERVACAACHAPPSDGEVIIYSETPRECARCHDGSPGGER